MSFRKIALYVAAMSLISSAVLAASKAAADAPLSTPKGITLQPLGKTQGYGLDKTTAAVVPRDKLVFATDAGMTLYTSDADQPGKSVCVEACARTWIPAKVAAGAVPVEGWTVIARADGTRQWAYKDRPLYSFVEDADPGSIAGNSPKRFSRGEFAGSRGAVSSEVPKDKPLAQGWNVAYFVPMERRPMPAGFAIKEVEDALGMVLVDTREHTLYTLEDSARAKTCAESCPWIPVPAPAIAEGIEDFKPVWRDDGVRQWTYKGKALYTFSGDLVAGDANGAGVDKAWKPAHFIKHFVPETVTLTDSEKLGKVFADKNGKTLYMRDAFIFQSGAGHSLRHGSPIRPAVGRDLATDPHCADDCLKSWHPFLAPKDAEANGNWGVYTRADGTKQWAYQGYALWTFDGDKRPGDINGNDDYQLFMSHDAKTRVDIGTPYDGPTALYWIAAHP